MLQGRNRSWTRQGIFILILAVVNTRHPLSNFVHRRNDVGQVSVAFVIATAQVRIFVPFRFFGFRFRSAQLQSQSLETEAADFF